MLESVKRLNELSETILNDTLAKIPIDKNHKFILFKEIIINLDYWFVYRKYLPEENQLSLADYEIMLQGWNLVLEHLCVDLEMGGIPICERTNNLQLSANTIIHCFGRSVLLKRVAKIVEAGLAEVSISKSNIEVKIQEKSHSLYLDILAFSNLDYIFSEIENSDKINGFSIRWLDFEFLDPDQFHESGAFIFNNTNEAIKQFQLPVAEVKDKIAELVFPWNSGYGIGTGYDALREIDLHYFSIALEYCDKARDDFGFHHSVQFGDISGEYLTSIIAVIVSLHLKHIDFVLVATEKFPEISPHFSLTIWTEKSVLVDEIVSLTAFDKEVVETILSAITLSPSEYNKLSHSSEAVIPFLIDLGNGFLLRPVSSLIKNPFYTAGAIQNLRVKNLENLMSRPREEWMRRNLYYMFKGNRYSVLEGNANLRTRGKIVTDIDAAILDITSGEIALFQIKWQDYFTNDVKKLLSKSSNLVKGIDDWAEKVEAWIEENGVNSLLQLLRIKVPKSKPIKKVLLFGLSKSFARTQGYGVVSKSSNCALCNWPEFVAARTTIGPKDQVFTKIFNLVQDKYDEKIDVIPLAHCIKVRDVEIKLTNLWNKF